MKFPATISETGFKRNALNFIKNHHSFKAKYNSVIIEILNKLINKRDFKNRGFVSTLSKSSSKALDGLVVGNIITFVGSYMGKNVFIRFCSDALVLDETSIFIYLEYVRCSLSLQVAICNKHLYLSSIFVTEEDDWVVELSNYVKTHPQVYSPEITQLFKTNPNAKRFFKRVFNER